MILWLWLGCAEPPPEVACATGDCRDEVVALAVGDLHVCLRRANGVVACAGSARQGQRVRVTQQRRKWEEKAWSATQVKAVVPVKPSQRRALDVLRGTEGQALEHSQPADVVPAVDAAFEAGVAYRLHLFAATLADVGPGQEGPVEQRAQPVVLQDRRARHLPHESAAEHAPHRTPGVVRSQAEQEGRPGAFAL